MTAISLLYIRLLLVAVSFITILLYLVRYFLALAPKKGTLEWISMVDKPRWGRCGVSLPGRESWWALPLGAAVSTGFSLLRDESPETLLLCAGGGLLMAFVLILFTGNGTASLCGSLLLGVAEAASVESLLLLFGLGFLMLSLSDRRLPRRLLWLLLCLAALAFNSVTYSEGEWYVTLPPIGYIRALCLPLCSLLLGLPVCLIQAFRLHRSSCLIGFLFLLLAPVNWFLGFTYPVYCCLILGFASLAGDACRRDTVLETFIATGVLLVSALVYQ